MKKHKNKGFKLEVVLKKTQLDIDQFMGSKATLASEITRLEKIKDQHVNELIASQVEQVDMLKGRVDTSLYLATSEYIVRKGEVINKANAEIDKRHNEVTNIDENMLKLIKMKKGLSDSKDIFYKQLKFQKNGRDEKIMDELFLTTRN
jgi:hypothetical protein